MRLVLRVNHADVSECDCNDKVTPHWSVADIRRALGRDVADADSLELIVRSDKGLTWE